MYARITTLHRSEAADSAGAFAEAAGLALPRVTTQSGCLGGLVLTDPVGNTLHAITFWRSAEELVDSGSVAKRITAEVAGIVGAPLEDAVVQVVNVTALDIARVDGDADRRDVAFPLLRGN